MERAFRGLFPGAGVGPIRQVMGSDLLFSHLRMANLTYRRVNGCLASTRLILLGGLSISLAVGNAGCRKGSTDLNAAGKDATTSGDGYSLHLEPFVVNLADTEDNRFLRIGIDLELTKPLPGKESGPPVARIRDCVIFVLSTWQSNSLLAPDGKQKLKDEVLHALQDRVPELGIKEVYFTEFLVQR